MTASDNRTFDDAESLARGAAEWLCALAVASNRTFSVCLSGGSTPKLLYRHLADPLIAAHFPWSRTHWFWGDERFVPHDHPDSNYRMAAEAFLSRVPAPPDNIHAVPTENLTPQQSAAAYEATLKKFYGADTMTPNRPLFDVTLLGIGDDGHTACPRCFPVSLRPLDETQKMGGRSDRRKIRAAHHAHLPGARQQPRCRVSRDRRRQARHGRPRPKRRPRAARRQNSSRRAAALVDRPRRRARVSTVMPQNSAPAILIVMGVSKADAAKTTIGTLLAQRLGWTFKDADWFHPAANIDKMEKGIPLTDDDRWPWLEKIAAWIGEALRAT